MSEKLYWTTVNPLLKSVLKELMKNALFDRFRLVGGTSLSLQLGHRISVDIDLFTDATYNSIDFTLIDKYLRKKFSYVTKPHSDLIGMGRSYFVGTNEEKSIKLDLYYTEPFIRPVLIRENIRLASVEDIIAMKIDVVQRGGRKKDFWDLHELLDTHSPEEMIRLHASRYPYSHDQSLILTNFTSFSSADEDFDPICMKNKYWELIKYEIIQSISK
ncbi:MAG TPA: nucleotidyl transferase AbiEii/AbiGii toxin family protein [Chitinophaga sp.]|uniref:nucleotidyl transferase AbiEii/AbiGii toxin family protein n=1 Tax=Chitinophaga sp. TaxID=1869181 RepID=UPI002B6C702E|nr:nucleotidyl transferase AbiEii/AbiGii toxin family protein [Chitinophaga sp.]HVI45781.1 nucleotidyl transferase AbiEii/AbiGii toxin family protein [Chitinophaga sp.]